MHTARHSMRAAVYLVLVQDGKVLLSRRFNTGWKDGSYSMIAGHLDGGERVTDAAIREAKEEGGLTIDNSALRVVHTMHRRSEEGVEYIDFFLKASHWTGRPTNLEPQKCDDLGWFELQSLPKSILPHVRKALHLFLSGTNFSEHGWDEHGD